MMRDTILFGILKNKSARRLFFAAYLCSHVVVGPRGVALYLLISPFGLSLVSSTTKRGLFFFACGKQSDGVIQKIYRNL